MSVGKRRGKPYQKSVGLGGLCSGLLGSSLQNTCPFSIYGGVRPNPTDKALPLTTAYKVVRLGPTAYILR